MTGKRHARVFHMLVANGHSAHKAAEIILDARRGYRYALDWIHLAHDMVDLAKWMERYHAQHRRSA